MTLRDTGAEAFRTKRSLPAFSSPNAACGVYASFVPFAPAATSTVAHTIVAATATLVAYSLTLGSDRAPESVAESRTVAVLVLFAVAMWVLGILARPFNTWRVGLVGSMAAAFFLVLAIPGLREYFELPLPNSNDLLIAVGVAAVACTVLEIGWHVAGWVDRNTSINLDMAAR